MYSSIDTPALSSTLTSSGLQHAYGDVRYEGKQLPRTDTSTSWDGVNSLDYHPSSYVESNAPWSPNPAAPYSIPKSYPAASSSYTASCLPPVDNLYDYQAHATSTGGSQPSSATTMSSFADSEPCTTSRSLYESPYVSYTMSPSLSLNAYGPQPDTHSDSCMRRGYNRSPSAWSGQTAQSSYPPSYPPLATNQLPPEYGQPTMTSNEYTYDYGFPSQMTTSGTASSGTHASSLGRPASYAISQSNSAYTSSTNPQLSATDSGYYHDSRSYQSPSTARGQKTARPRYDRRTG